VRDRYKVREGIGVLSDARGLYPRLTARENVRYFALCTAFPAPVWRPASPRCCIRWDSMRWPIAARRLLAR